MRDRRLTTIVTDTFTAPRYIHHAFKALTGAIVLTLVYCLLRSGIPIWLSACILSFAWVITTKIAARLERGSSVYEVGPDLICDVALHLLPVGFILTLWWSWPLGLGIMVLLSIAYVLTYPEASP